MPIIPSLTNSYIDETYPRLVQVSGSSFADGLGNPIPSLLTTASAAGNTITFTKGDSTQFSVSVTAAGLSGGTDGYIPLWSGSNTLTSSYLSQLGNVLKTTTASIETGLNLNFNTNTHWLGNSALESFYANTNNYYRIGKGDGGTSGYSILEILNGDIKFKDPGLAFDFFHILVILNPLSRLRLRSSGNSSLAHLL